MSQMKRFLENLAANGELCVDCGLPHLFDLAVASTVPSEWLNDIIAITDACELSAFAESLSVDVANDQIEMWG